MFKISNGANRSKIQQRQPLLPRDTEDRLGANSRAPGRVYIIIINRYRGLRIFLTSLIATNNNINKLISKSSLLSLVARWRNFSTGLEGERSPNITVTFSNMSYCQKEGTVS